MKQTPPASYRRQVDLHYSSLPRQAYPSSVTVPTNSTTGSSTAVSGNQVVDNNANPKQRNVAFGKNFHLLPSSASKSASNVYHHQLVLYQHPTQLLKGFQNQRGFSVPNLGFSYFFIKWNMFSLLNFFIIMNLLISCDGC